VKNEFLNYEQAQDLKELGFYEPCFGYWKLPTWLIEEKTRTDGYNHADQLCAAPLKQQAFKFFRDKLNLYSTINVDITMEPKFCYSIYEYDLEKYSEGWWIAVVNSDLYYTHEEAEIKCLDKLIEIVKEKILWNKK